MEEREEEAARKAIDEGLSVFITVARFHGISIDPAQIVHDLAIGPNGMTEIDILKAAKRVKLKAKAVGVKFEKLKKLRAPLIVETKVGGFLVVARI